MKEDEDKDGHTPVSVSAVGVMAGAAVFPTSGTLPAAATVGNLMVCYIYLICL